MRTVFGTFASATVLALAAGTALADEKCYGVAAAGKGTGPSGASSVDYQGDAWVMVADGTCLTTALPVQPDGTPRRGSLEPIDRDRP